MALSTKNKASSPKIDYFILERSLARFRDSTARFFDYNLLECRIGPDSKGRLSVGYVGHNEEGERKSFSVALDGEEIVLNRCELIQGYQGFKVVKGDPKKNAAEFRSSVLLFLTDLAKWSKLNDVNVDSIILRGLYKNDIPKLDSSKSLPNGELKLVFGEPADE